MNTRRRSTSWQLEHLKLWRSNPRRAMASSRTTFVKIISAPQTIQRIACLTKQQPSNAIVDEKVKNA
jgi:hypothetical protein